MPSGYNGVVSYYRPYYPDELTEWFYKDYYQIKSGAGTYGATSGTTLTGASIIKLGSIINEPDAPLPLGDIGASTVSTAMNAQSPSLTKSGFTTVSATISGTVHVYVFDADDGDYGVADNLTSAANFIDVNTEPDWNNKIPTGNSNIFIRGTDVTLGINDIERTNEFSQASAVITLPFDAATKFEQGTWLKLYFTGTGTHSLIRPTSSATTETLSYNQNDLVFVQKRSNNSLSVVGTDKWIVKQVGKDPSLSSFVQKSAAYTLTDSDEIIECTANSFTITLPTAVGISGRTYTIDNSGTGDITLAFNGAEHLNGVTSPVIYTDEVFIIYSNGTNWRLK